MSRFRRVDRKTAYLFPPSVEDWLPQDHLPASFLKSRTGHPILTKQFAMRTKSGMAQRLGIRFSVSQQQIWLDVAFVKEMEPEHLHQ